MVEERELQQKLADLKQYTEAYDKALAEIRTAQSTKRFAFFDEMNQAEKAYNTLWNWFREHGYSIQWNTEQKQYEAISSTYKE